MRVSARSGVFTHLRLLLELSRPLKAFLIHPRFPDFHGKRLPAVQKFQRWTDKICILHYRRPDPRSFDPDRVTWCRRRADIGPSPVFSIRASDTSGTKLHNSATTKLLLMPDKKQGNKLQETKQPQHTSTQQSESSEAWSTRVRGPSVASLHKSMLSPRSTIACST